MKKILISFFIVVVVVSGCIKDKVDPLDNTDTPYLKFSLVTPTSSFPLISLVPDGSQSEQFLSFVDNGMKAKLEGPVTAPSDVTVKYEIDAAALAKLNADALAKNPNYKPFFLLPDSTFKILVKQDVIKQGSVYAEKETDNIVIYPGKIDPSINYIIPLKLSSSSYASSQGTSTIFYYIIGNPIAGTYKWAWTRWNAADTTGAPNAASFTFAAGITNAFIPVDATTIEVQSGYGDQNGTDIRYQLSFTNTNGVLSNFKVKIKPEDVTDGIYAFIGALSYTEASILLADAANKHFRFSYAVVNGAGAARIFIDDFKP